jgi:hypothetical protein
VLANKKQNSNMIVPQQRQIIDGQGKAIPSNNSRTATSTGPSLGKIDREETNGDPR